MMIGLKLSVPRRVVPGQYRSGLVATAFLSHAGKFTDAIAQGKILAPAKTMSEMSRIAFNDYVDATLAALFVAVVIAMVVYGVLAGIKAMRNPRSTAVEIGGVAIAAE